MIEKPCLAKQAADTLPTYPKPKMAIFIVFYEYPPKTSTQTFTSVARAVTELNHNLNAGRATLGLPVNAASFRISQDADQQSTVSCVATILPLGSFLFRAMICALKTRRILSEPGQYSAPGRDEVVLRTM
jgi:hypothetical protein